MRLLDDRSRLFGVVNPVDLVVVVLLLVMLLAVANVLFGRTPVVSQAMRAKQDMEVVLVARDLTDFDPSYLHRGDVVSKVTGSGSMGTIESFEAKPSAHEIVGPDSTLKTASSPLYQDVYITITGKGTLTDAAVSIGDEQIHQNQDMDVMTSRFQTRVRVLSYRVVR